jgi:hypothetical protein
VKSFFKKKQTKKNNEAVAVTMQATRFLKTEISARTIRE